MKKLKLALAALLAWDSSILFPKNPKNPKTLDSVFPLKGYITQEIIDKAILPDPTSCIGALTLKAALAEQGISNTHISWGLAYGDVFEQVDSSKDKHVSVTTIDNINMMDVEAPREVLFINTEAVTL